MIKNCKIAVIIFLCAFFTVITASATLDNCLEINVCRSDGVERTILLHDSERGDIAVWCATYNDQWKMIDVKQVQIENSRGRALVPEGVSVVKLFTFKDDFVPYAAAESVYFSNETADIINQRGATEFTKRRAYREFNALSQVAQDSIRQIIVAMEAQNHDLLLSVPIVSDEVWEECEWIYTMVDDYKVYIESLPHESAYVADRIEYSVEIRPENGVGLSCFVVTSGDSPNVTLSTCPCVNWQYNGSFLGEQTTYSRTRDNIEYHSTTTGQIVDGLFQGELRRHDDGGYAYTNTVFNGIVTSTSSEGTSSLVGKIGDVSSGSVVYMSFRNVQSMLQILYW